MFKFFLFLMLSLSAFSQVKTFTEKTWIHPETLRAFNNVSSHKVVVDGESRWTGYLPKATQYKNAVYLEFSPLEKAEIPSELDYTMFAPPKVVKQQCGDCWAQGGAMAFEGVVGWMDKASKNFSRQAVIDCSGFGSCGGGELSVGFYKSPKGGVNTSDYPYVGHNQRCKSEALLYKESARNTGYVRGSRGKDFKVQDLQKALMSYGPLEVCGASSALGGGDSDGFLSKNKGGGTDHCWALYGWYDGAKHGKAPGIYFIMVNSWGSSWGKDGKVYIKLAQNGTDLDGNAVTEAAFIDYKDVPPPGPVLPIHFQMSSSEMDLNVTVDARSKKSWEEVKARLQQALNALHE